MSGGLRPEAAPFVPPPGRAGGATATATGGDNGSDDAELAALAARFPSFSFPSLREVLVATRGDLASAEMLVASIAGSARAAGAAAAAEERQRQEPRRQQQPLPLLTAFPSLGGGGGGGGEGGGGGSAAAAAPPPPRATLSLPPLRRKTEVTAPTDFLREEDFALSFPALGAAAPAEKRPEQQSETERRRRLQGASFAAAALSDPREAEAAARAAAAAAAARAAPPAAAAGRRLRQAAAGPSAGGPVQWVSTGAAVSGAYAEARERARALCVARNVAFEQATQAYLRGDKAAAKELGAQGRGFAAEMREEHERAAASIFESRNNAHSPPLSSSSRASPRPDSAITLDLHGLHVAEGVAAVERAIERAREESRGGSGGGRGGAATSARAARATTLNLIVGAGKHTTHGAGRRARLPLAVKSKLDELGVEWEEGRVEGMVAAFV
jgi:hypothetical protein